MDRTVVRELLQALAEGRLELDAAMERLAVEPVARLTYATVDLNREMRTGVPEVVFGAGKTAEQIAGILGSLRARGQSALATRVDPEKAALVQAAVGPGQHEYHPLAQVFETRVGPRPAPVGHIGLISAGTSDLPVMEEARVIAEALGNVVSCFPDIGVAGLHRLLGRLEEVRRCHVLIVVAGMDGALPAVVAGLVQAPVIAVPTSVGYGAAFGGLAPLLTMLNACAAGVSVVNIDNGFGAAYQASLINHLAARAG